MLFVEMKNHLVRKVDAKTGTISTVAGTGELGFGGDGGPATKAQLSIPHSIALDADDNLYIADIGNHRIRKVDAKIGHHHHDRRQRREEAAGGWAARGRQADDWPAGPVRRWRHALDRAPRGAQRLEDGSGQRSAQRTSPAPAKGVTRGDGGPAKDATFDGPKGIAIGPDKGDLCRRYREPRHPPDRRGFGQDQHHRRPRTACTKGALATAAPPRRPRWTGPTASASGRRRRRSTSATRSTTASGGFARKWDRAMLCPAGGFAHNKPANRRQTLTPLLPGCYKRIMA